MRQHAVVIDVENNRVGFASTTCAFDPLQIQDEQELLNAGQKTALDPNLLDSKDEKSCNHYKVIQSENWWKPTRQSQNPNVSNPIEKQKSPKPEDGAENQA